MLHPECIRSETFDLYNRDASGAEPLTLTLTVRNTLLILEQLIVQFSMFLKLHYALQEVIHKSFYLKPHKALCFLVDHWSKASREIRSWDSISFCGG